MRAFVVALVLAAAAGAACAQGPGTGNTGSEIQERVPAPTVPGGAKQQAIAAIKQGLDNSDSARFKSVRTSEVATIRHGPFADPIDGPVAIVCGQVSTADSAGAQGPYVWFFAALKRGQILWTATDNAADGAGDAYYSCKGAGLAS